MNALGRLAAGLAILSAVSAAAAMPTAALPEPASKQWLGVISLTRPELHDESQWSNREKDIRQRHFEYWQRLTAEGKVILVGRTLDEIAPSRLAPDAIGIFIFEAADRPTADGIMRDDPGVRHGLWRFRLSSYRVALSR